MHYHPSSIEPLEARIAPAAITATFAGGKLKIMGDDDANSAFLNNGFGNYKLSTDTGTHLIFNGADLGDAGEKEIFELLTDVSVDLGAGNDSFEISGGNFVKNVTIKGGAGKDTIKTNFLHVGGTFAVDGGTEDDTLMLESTLQAGKLVVDMGAGTNQLQFNNTELGVEGDSSIKAGAGVDTVTTGQSTKFSFGGKLDFALGGGDDSIDFGSNGRPDLFEVGGKLSITAGAHTGNLKVNFKTIVFRVGGDFNLTTDGSTGGTNDITVDGFFAAVTGKTTFKSTKNAVDNYAISGNQFQSLSLDLGEGKNTTSISNGLTCAALTYKGGAGDDKIVLSGSAPTTIVGFTDVKLGDGTNEFSEAYANLGGQSLTFGGGLAVTGGKNGDTVSFDVSDLTIGGKGAKLTLGDGAGTVLLKARGSVGIYGSLTSTSGAGDTTATVNGNLVNIRGGVSATFGSGKGELDLLGRLEVGGGVKFTATGAGDDTLKISGTPVAIKGAVTAKGDAGALNVTFDSAGQIDLGSVNVTTKSGGGATTFHGAGTIYGKFTYNGGTGANTVDLGNDNNSLGLLFLLDDVSVTSADATTGTQIKLHRVFAYGDITAKLGAAADTVSVDASDIAGAFNLDTGAGGDNVNLRTDGTYTGGLRFYGPLKVLTGAGDDTVKLGTQSPIQFFAAKASVIFDGGDGTGDKIDNTGSYDGQNSPFLPTEKNFETTTP